MPAPSRAASRTPTAPCARCFPNSSTVKVNGVYRSNATPVRQHEPDNPLADANGDVWAAPVDESAEMVEMMDSARQYQNVVEALQTSKQLMLDTLRMRP